VRSINLKLLKKTSISIEFDNILPELLFDKTAEQIGESIVYRGNKEEKLSQHFEVDVEGHADNADDCTINICGDLSRVKRIGYAMSAGKIVANSDVDFHVGACMSGGRIIVNGDAESYAGREMSGGTLDIRGNVKEFCGSSYAGEWRGMSGGKIIVHGNAGKQLADYMTGGNITIMGDCDILAGVHMAGGLIQIDGNVNKWVGGQMKKGTIVVNGHVDEILPSFSYDETITNPFINKKYYFGTYKLYSGDKSVNGKGQLWIRK
jgi:formylmethanofuran dehydrogenase subunit C